MHLRLLALSAVVVAAAAMPVALSAQTSARSVAGVLDTLDRVRAFHETAISPDGRRVAWVEDAAGAADGTTAIGIRDLAGVPIRMPAPTG